MSATVKNQWQIDVFEITKFPQVFFPVEEKAVEVAGELPVNCGRDGTPGKAGGWGVGYVKSGALVRN